MILVTTHQDADFDGAAGILGAMLLHPGSVAVFPGAKEASLRGYLEREPSLLPEIRMRDIDLDRVTTLVLVDTVSSNRIGALASLLQPGSKVRVLAYDHHPGVETVPGVELVSEQVGAVTTIIVNLLKARGVRLSTSQATFMAIGIYEDTGNLLHRGTTPRDLEAVSWLLRQGADLSRVSKALTRDLTPEQIELYHALLHEAKTVRIRGRDVVVATLEPDDFVFDAAVVVQQFVRATGAVRMVALIRMEDRIFMIARSAAPDFDASVLARRLGGGGHQNAASATLRGRTLMEARSDTLSILAGTLQPPNTAADLATPILHSLTVDATISEGVAMLNRCRVNGLPIFEGGRVIGALTRQAADIALHHGLGKNSVRDLVTEEVELVSTDLELDEVKDRLLSGNTRFILVGDSEDDIQGLITRTALLRHLSEGRERSEEKVFPNLEAQADPSTTQDCTALMEKGLPEEAMRLLRGIGALAGEQGSPAYLVGGVVRDLLLGLPNRDLDVVVEGDACSTARLMARQFGGTVKVHKAFQTAEVVLPGGTRLDLVSARTEHYPRAAALPDVTAGSLPQDLSRRDFTINTLAISLSPASFGRLLDHYGGRKDLARRKLRVLHGLSFIEDPTRAFRAVRFALRLKFAVSGETANLIRIAKREGVFERLSFTRVRRELELLFEEGRLARQVKALESFGLLSVIHPGFQADDATMESLDRLDEAIAWYRVQGHGDSLSGWVLAMTVLAGALEEDERLELWDRFAPGREDRRILREGSGAVHRLIYTLAGHRRMRPSIVHRACDGLPLEILLLAMISTRRDSVREAVISFIADLREVVPDITGRDLVEAGVPEGPAISRGIAAALAAKLDGEAMSRSRQLAVAIDEATRSA